LALIVAKNNPKNLTNDLKQLTNPNLNVVLGDASLGSVGRVSLKILKKHGIAKQAYKNAIYLTSDSRHIAKAFKQKEADIALSWLATSFWTENKKHLEAIEIDYPPKIIEINLLNFSKEKDLSNRFIDFVTSPHGLETFKNYGF
jgi:molybdate transport system substrate-binding protein